MKRAKLASLVGVGASLVTTAVAFAPGCQHDPTRGTAPEAAPVYGTVNCVDNDGDGYGDGCRAGPDCNDNDPAVTNECYRCKTGGPGCPCTDEGLRKSCGRVEADVGSQVVCGQGVTVCSNGVWGDCIINNAVTLQDKPAKGTQALAGPSPCAANPCDPTCQQFPDTPGGMTFDGGILGSDGGISLVGTNQPDPPSQCTGGQSGTCAHSLCGTGAALTAGCDSPANQWPSCVTAICAQNSACCTSSWSAACVAQVVSVCNLGCANVGGQCAVCYQDAYDHDGDGYSYQQGDCSDCDPAVNPGAYDFPGNGVDEDCSGTADDEPTGCDSGSLAMASSVPGDYAKAMDICRTSTAAATGKQKTWGVLTSALVQADGTSTPHSLSYGILSQFGANNLPQQGQKMAVFSSGTARATGDPGWVNPNGQVASFNQGKACAYPAGFPKNATGCPNGTGFAYDSTGLKMDVRVPTNAKSFSYKFDFFSTEYPEWVCTSFNDGFVALLKTGYMPANPAANSSNISFDSKNNPVSVNIGFFGLTSGPKLNGTAMDGTCWGQICGGGTDWLESTAPVVPGETITLQFSIWDTGDHLWDSFILIDDFEWSVSSATIQTFKPSPPPPPKYAGGSFARDYDVSGLCPSGFTPVWGVWSWSATTPKDSSVEFYVTTASTLAGLNGAPEDALLFSQSTGPSALVGQAAVAKAGNPDTELGALVVDDTLKAKGRARQNNFVRVRSHLTPSTDMLASPTLQSWNLQFDCQPTE